MAQGMHNFSPLLYTDHATLRAASRTTTGGVSGGATYVATPTVGATSGAIDLSQWYGPMQVVISAGTVATSLDGKWQESVDGTTWTDLASGSITQLTAAGSVVKEVRVRQFTKRYARFLITLGGTCVFAVVSQGFPRLAE